MLKAHSELMGYDSRGRPCMGSNNCCSFVTCLMLFFNFIGTYLADYILTMGLVSMASPDIIVTDINSTNDCARTCSMMSSFQCKAAQFCGVNSMCLLFKERSLGKYGTDGNNPCYYLKSKPFSWLFTLMVSLT